MKIELDHRQSSIASDLVATSNAVVTSRIQLRLAFVKSRFYLKKLFSVIFGIILMAYDRCCGIVFPVSPLAIDQDESELVVT